MRVLVERGSGAAGRRVSLDAGEVHHLKVRRARDRDTVEILDGAGFRGTGSLVQVGREWMVEIETIERTEQPPETTLAVAAGDRERFFWMVEKSVELAAGVGKRHEVDGELFLLPPFDGRSQLVV